MFRREINVYGAIDGALIFFVDGEFAERALKLASEGAIELGRFVVDEETAQVSVEVAVVSDVGVGGDDKDVAFGEFERRGGFA